MVEILGYDGKVHYRRPADHDDVIQALRTEGYGLRGPLQEWTVIHAAMGRDGGVFDFYFTVNDISETQSIFYAGPVGAQFTRQDAREWRVRCQKQKEVTT